MMTGPPPHDVPVTPPPDQVTTDLTRSYGDIQVQVVITRPAGMPPSAVIDALRGAQRSVEVWLTHGVTGQHVTIGSGSEW